MNKTCKFSLSCEAVVLWLLIPHICVNVFFQRLCGDIFLTIIFLHCNIMLFAGFKCFAKVVFAFVSLCTLMRLQNYGSLKST